MSASADWEPVTSCEQRLYTSRSKTFNELKDIIRQPLRYCKGEVKVTITRHFLMFDRVTFGELVN